MAVNFLTINSVAWFHSDVIWVVWPIKSPAAQMFVKVIQANNIEDIKTLHY